MAADTPLGPNAMLRRPGRPLHLDPVADSLALHVGVSIRAAKTKAAGASRSVFAVSFIAAPQVDSPVASPGYQEDRVNQADPQARRAE